MTEESAELESLAKTVQTMLDHYGEFIPSKERLEAIRDALLELAVLSDYPDE